MESPAGGGNRERCKDMTPPVSVLALAGPY